MAGTRRRIIMESTGALLWQADEPTPQAKVDAIIVPTVRPVDIPEGSGRRRTFPGLPAGHLAQPGNGRVPVRPPSTLVRAVDLIAIDVPESAHLRLPVLETSRLLAGTIFERRTDVSTKRNLALVLSHMLRWKRVVFLDDDIRVPDPADLSQAVGLLDTHTAVGLGIGGFPDNSVVCHAFRDAGGRQETFIGGGALAVDVKRNRSFFPNIYNEDWFFVLDAGKRLQSVATVGRGPPGSLRPLPARAGTGGGIRRCARRRHVLAARPGQDLPRMVTWRTGGSSWPSGRGSSSRSWAWSSARQPSSQRNGHGWSRR